MSNNISPEELRFFAQKEVDAVVNCDIFIKLFAPTRGCHVELGIALAAAQSDANKKIYLWSESAENYLKNPSAFYYHPKVNQCSGNLTDFAKRVVLANSCDILTP